MSIRAILATLAIVVTAATFLLAAFCGDVAMSRLLAAIVVATCLGGIAITHHTPTP